MLTFHKTAGNREVVKPSVLLTLLECRGNRHEAVGFDTWSPELIINVHLREGNLLDRSVGSLVGALCASRDR